MIVLLGTTIGWITCYERTKLKKIEKHQESKETTLGEQDESLCQLWLGTVINNLMFRLNISLVSLAIPQACDKESRSY